MPFGNLQIYLCSSYSSYSNCPILLIIPKGTGAFGKLKVHVLQISLLFLDTPIVQVIPGGVCLCAFWGIPDSCVFLSGDSTSGNCSM